MATEGVPAVVIDAVVVKRHLRAEPEIVNQGLHQHATGRITKSQYEIRRNRRLADPAAHAIGSEKFPAHGLCIVVVPNIISEPGIDSHL